MVNLKKEKVQKYFARIKYLRNVKKLTQQKVADQLGINKNSYSNFETESRFLSVEKIKQLSEMLGEDLENEKVRSYINQKIREKRNISKTLI